MRGRSAFPAAAVLLMMAATRWPLAPEYLYFFDSVNFALALDHFDPSQHQPQPPGYPLFVGFTRLIHLFVARPEHVFLLAGILAGAAAVLLVWKLGSEMFGRAAGLIAGGLLFANPAFWLAGLSNQVRVFLALSTTAVALLAWRAAMPGARPAWLYCAFAALGVAAGFRPETSVLMAPLLLWAWWRGGRSVRRLFAAGLFLCLAAAPWLAATVIASGGVESWLRLLWDYSNQQFQPSSAVFGAAAPSAWRMFLMATAWNFLGAAAWIWAAPFTPPRFHDPEWRRRAAFLLLWFAPAFLFSAFIHIGDPDQALGSIPALCLAGGATLASYLERRGTKRAAAAATAVAALNALLFFVPPFRLARAASYRAISGMDRTTRHAMSALKELRREGPLTIVHYGAAVSWRHLYYYFSEEYLIVLPGDLADTTGADRPWEFFRRTVQTAPRDAGVVESPPGRRVVCLLPQGRGAALVKAGWREHGPAVAMEAIPPGGLALGPYRVVTGAASTASSQ